MTNSSPSSSPPMSSSPGDAPLAPPPLLAAEETSHDATRGGVNGPASPDPRERESPLSIDLTGELCPFTFVRTKLALEDLPIGAELRVIVDHEPAVRNVPRSAIEWGQEVLGVTRLSVGTWAIDLRKRVR